MRNDSVQAVDGQAVDGQAVASRTVDRVSVGNPTEAAPPLRDDHAEQLGVGGPGDDLVGHPPVPLGRGGRLGDQWEQPVDAGQDLVGRHGRARFTHHSSPSTSSA